MLLTTFIDDTTVKIAKALIDLRNNNLIVRTNITIQQKVFIRDDVFHVMPPGMNFSDHYVAVIDFVEKTTFFTTEITIEGQEEE
jgi:hypothetical protein